MPKILSITALVVIAGSLLVWRLSSVHRDFESKIVMVRLGMTERDVIRVLGKPKGYKNPCYSQRPNCNQDMIYVLPFDFVSFWTISLDQSGDVIGKFHWQSP